MKRIYIGDIYKVTKMSSNYTPKRVTESYNFGIGNWDEIVIPESVSSFNDGYELYLQQVLMIKISDSPFSDFIIIDKNLKWERIHSFPICLNSLFVDTTTIKPYNIKEKENLHKLIKYLRKK